MDNSAFTVDLAFFLAVAILVLLLILLLASLRANKTQFWPPPDSSSWQYFTLWWGIRVLLLCIGIVAYLDHSTWDIPSTWRFFVALPVFLFSFSIGMLGTYQLGWKNTHGIAEGFIDSGLYRFSRNPQYVLYSISFLSLAVLVASIKGAILLSLLAAWYLLAPFPEEKWLENKYGEAYREYKSKVPRYIGVGGVQ